MKPPRTRRLIPPSGLSPVRSPTFRRAVASPPPGGVTPPPGPPTETGSRPRRVPSPRRETEISRGNIVSLGDDRALAVSLGAHEHYRDADLYDHEYRRRRDDVAFYVDLAARVLGGPGRILELGCGTGRITAALARAGHTVVALDAAPEMLAGLAARRARLPKSVAARIEPVQGDLRLVDVPGRFGLVVAGFNVLEHLYTRVELDACLRAVRRRLGPDGRFAFDVQLPDGAWLARDPGKRWARTRFRHPRTGVPTWYSTNHDYDPVSQIVIIRLYYAPVDGGPEEVVLLSQRKFYPAELEALVAHAGLRTLERYGDFGGGALGPGCESQILVCGKAPAARSGSLSRRR